MGTAALQSTFGFALVSDLVEGPQEAEPDGRHHDKR